MKKTAGVHLQFLQELPGMEQLEEDLPGMNASGNVGFLCYDITSLRKVNRAYGRSAGDALLAAVVRWVQDFPQGRLYRVEGDQFCVAFQGVPLERVHQYAGDLENRFDKMWSLELDGQEIEVFAQAAIAVLGDLECDYDCELMDVLEQALELSRKNRSVTVFSAEHDRLTREHARLQVELKNCVFADMRGFSVQFQPFTDAAKGTWCGLETLCRWRGPTIGPVPPNIFIAEVEEAGLIHQLGEWVLNTALQACKELGLDKLERFFVSVNVSALQMNKRDYADTVLQALERHDYPAGKLLLEITESTRFSFNEVTRSCIEVLREQGLRLALDDFGTGYSGFSNLRNLPVDVLKTDRDFIQNIENDNYLQYFYYVMSEAAHASGMRLIAEGIETTEQLHSVVKNGADLIQGYLFGRPMDKSDIGRQKANFTHALEEFADCMSDAGQLTDYKQWIHSQKAYKITPSLFGLQSKCIDLILNVENDDQAFEEILEAVGLYFKVNRAYVFVRDGGAVFSNRYEWCAEGVQTQKHLFQNVDGALDGFYEVLQENEVVIAKNSGQLPQNLSDRLQEGEQQGSVQSMVVMPMKQRGEILGFVGFDHSLVRDWMPEELLMLHNLCLLCLIIVARKEKG